MFFVFNHQSTLAQTFSNYTDELGINALLYNNNFGSGVSFADFNGDGQDDLSVGLTGEPCKFFRNVGGSLQPVSLGLPNLGAVKALQWVDIDNDGDRDLFITVRNGNLKLYRNDGNLQFTDITAGSGLHQNTTQNTYGASWGDYDKDGFLDVYICNYSFSLAAGTPEDKNHLYRNNGDGTFTDVTEDAGVAGNVDLSFQSVWVDYDRDSWPDLYVINDKISPNRLYRNLGDGTFEEMTENGSAIVIDAMTASVADYNRDGLLDIYCTNTQAGNVLLQGIEGGFFEDVATETNTILYDYTWGACWFDMDNDTDLDMYICESEALAFNSPNYLYRNNGPDSGYTFEDVSELLLEDNLSDAYVVASGDLEDDGHIDIVVHNRAPYNLTFWRNNGTENNYVKIELEGDVSNRDAIGCWIELWVDGLSYLRHTHLGEQYLAQNSFKQHFGLGAADHIDSLHVEWPSGWTDYYYDLSVNTTHHFKEGDSVVPQVLAEQGHLCAGDSIYLEATIGDNPIWSNGVSASGIWVNEPGNYSYTATIDYGIGVTSETIEISDSAIPEPEFTVIPPSCFGESDASVSFSFPEGVSGDLLNFFAGSLSTGELTGLSAGDYELLTINGDGCEANFGVSIPQPEAIVVAVEQNPISCSGESTELSFTASGGTGELSFNYPGYDPGAVLAGDYLVEVSDEVGCLSTESFTVVEPQPLNVEADIVPALDEVLGSLLLTVAGGTEPYSVNWSGPDGFSSTDFVLAQLLPGIYSAVVTDANNCLSLGTFQVDQLTGIASEGLPEIRVYPNPAGQAVNIELATNEIALLRLWNTQGKLVYEGTIQGKKTMDTSHLASGWYVLQIQQSSQLIQEVLVIE